MPSEQKITKLNEQTVTKKTDKEFIAQIVLIAVLALLLVFNIGRMTIGTIGITGATTISGSEIIPNGVPKIYGKELGVSYNDIDPNDPRKADAVIGILANLDNTVTLTGADLQRYINVGLQISCEYCCGAEAIIFSNGKAACGCAHSYAMRGLAKYLIKNHGTEFSDDQVLEELGKWKVLFFPDIHKNKASVLKSKGIEINYINLASNKYRGIEQGATSGGGGMVGGC